ncbi:DNA replication and repair RecF family protein [Clostridioides difficile 342]|nr:DNA replication and repair protein RecF [Clostridioides difficile]EQF78540.1 DNA replication and repair RecF family protein [Clostridioides difficile 342]
MKLKSLQLVNFRNYKKLHLEFNGKVNLLVGKNGQGKTNIVESIYMLSFGKSFRTNKDKEMVRFNSENLYIGGSFSKYNKYSLIELIIGKDKKGIRINKVPLQKIQELLGNLNVVIFSPEDLRLVKEGPKERRAFIDKEISQIIPKYYKYLTNYNKTLSQRSRCLKIYMLMKLY